MHRLLIAIIILIGISAKSQKMTTAEYIEKYKKVAIAEMKEYKIPASITMAQGILESASGNSYLAREAKNHFGIKCHRDWEGKKVYRDDDKKNECFRAYKHASESYRDHSIFLTTRVRYAPLFEEEITDYKAWAKGLKKAGYATNKRYPALLIRIIEENELYKLDHETVDDDYIEELDLSTSFIQLSSNKVKFIVAREDDTFESIAKQTENYVTDLLAYNELRYDAVLKPGQRVYLQPKRRRSYRKIKTHTVKKRDTMYGISQQYAIKLKYLYRRNKMNAGEQPKPGVVIKLR